MNGRGPPRRTVLIFPRLALIVYHLLLSGVCLPTYSLTMFVYGPCCLCHKNMIVWEEGREGVKRKANNFFAGLHAIDFAQCVTFTTIVVRIYRPCVRVSFTTKRGWGRGGRGTRAQNNVDAAVQRFGWGRGGRVSREQNDTHGELQCFMDLCSCSFRDQNRRHARDFYTT